MNDFECKLEQYIDDNVYQTDKNEKSLTKAEQDLNNAIRDGECLIKGCIPADYIKK